jgi:hypothetical protein
MHLIRSIGRQLKREVQLIHDTVATPGVTQALLNQNFGAGIRIEK